MDQQKAPIISQEAKLSAIESPEFNQMRKANIMHTISLGHFGQMLKFLILKVIRSTRIIFICCKRYFKRNQQKQEIYYYKINSENQVQQLLTQVSKSMFLIKLKLIIEQHKESQKLWIQDKGPIIETNIGFIETYLDPMKVKTEYEGFVSIFKQEESKLLVNLVEKAENIIKGLHWLKEFQIEKFSRPDLISLEILLFACFGTQLASIYQYMMMLDKIQDQKMSTQVMYNGSCIS
ncbi:unnamed protein product [Paramecium primaurelia]|uniref:Uncharacterized protein n=1 Tax=Paramecium primaurelia TaxID=5886 RepID=A0A8S1JPP1_PARPR|nr:unnamed protein product [Paramecium primaurelia]